MEKRDASHTIIVASSILLVALMGGVIIAEMAGYTNAKRKNSLAKRK
jgi:hypothetical protein